MMAYVTYTEKEVSDIFVHSGSRPEISVVDPVFLALRDSMGLKPNSKVESHPFSLMTLRQYYGDYVSQNKPCVIQGMGAEWPALTNWNFNYLAEQEQQNPKQIHYSNLQRAQDQHDPWFMIAAQGTISRRATLPQAIRSIQQNANDIQKGFTTALTYIENQSFTFSQVRPDYELPSFPQQFMRF